MVIDTESGRVVADIPGQNNAHGVALAPGVGRGFISDGGGEGAVLVFDLKSDAILGSLAALPDADGIIFDPSSGYVLVVSGRGKALMTFRPDIDLTKERSIRRSRSAANRSSWPPMQPARCISISWIRTKWVWST